jgi:hypothetical protein
MIGAVMGFKWFVVAAAAVACGNSSPAKPVKKDAAVAVDPNPSRVLSVAHFDEPVIVLPKQESFTLLAPGTGAKAALRYQLAAATSESHGQTRLESRRLSGGTWGPVVKLPPIDDGFAITIEADRKRPLGFRPLVGTIGGTTQTPEAEQYLATWRTIEKRMFGVVFDDRGQLGEISFADDPTMTRSGEAKDELVQRLLATVIPLPDEPVGTGAKWRVVTILRQRPAIVKQTATYTLTARDKRWRIGVEVTRIGEPQVVTDPNLPKGAAANILALVRKLHGTVDLDPTRPLPTGTLAVESTLHARIAIPGPDPTKDPGRVEELILDDHGTVQLTAK